MSPTCFLLQFHLLIVAVFIDDAIAVHDVVALVMVMWTRSMIV